MNFDINQDLSSLQKARNPRNRRIRPDAGKAKSAAAGPSQPKPKQHPTAEQQPAPPQPTAQTQPTALPQPTSQPQHISAAKACPPVTSINHSSADLNTLADAPDARQCSLVPQPDPVPENLQGRQPTATTSRAALWATSQDDAGVAIDALVPEPDQAADDRQNLAIPGPSQLHEAPNVVPIPDPIALDDDRALQAEHPTRRVPPAVDGVPVSRRRKAPARKKAVPELGTSISKKSPKPRKKAKQKNNEAAVPQSSSLDQECSTAMVTCDIDVENNDQPLAVTKAVVNQYDEMTRALCAGKRHQGKRKKIDPAAPIDPKNMTLMDVIRHAHSNANMLDRKYKEMKANQQKEKEQAAASAIDDSPAPPVQDEAEPSTSQAPVAPQLVLRDGKIVVDEDSLRVKATGPVGLRRVEVEEDDDTLINSHSYLPVSKLTKERWTRQETDLFYQILTSFGADFTFMSQCFQGRTRKQVKNKYLKEQKVNPARVREAMSGRQTATLAQLTSLAQPGTAAAGIAAMLPDADNAVGENSVIADAQDDAEEDAECMPVDTVANEFFY